MFVKHRGIWPDLKYGSPVLCSLIEQLKYLYNPSHGKIVSLIIKQQLRD